MRELGPALDGVLGGRVVVATLVAAIVLKQMISGEVQVGQWVPPGSGDMRSPCPALNTLANHGFLPRNGMNITRSNLTSALENVYNISSILANTLAIGAISVDGENSQISLDELDKHGTIEHDASMTRLDTYFGDNHSLNPDLFNGLLNATTDGAVLTESDFAAYQSIRQADSKANNPDFDFGLKQQGAAAGEPALFLAVFGQYDGNSYNVTLSSLKSVFGLEQLPSDWTTTANGEVTTLQVGGIAASIRSKWTSA